MKRYLIAQSLVATLATLGATSCTKKSPDEKKAEIQNDAAKDITERKQDMREDIGDERKDAEKDIAEHQKDAREDIAEVNKNAADDNRDAYADRIEKRLDDLKDQ